MSWTENRKGTADERTKHCNENWENVFFMTVNEKWNWDQDKR